MLCQLQQQLCGICMQVLQAINNRAASDNEAELLLYTRDCFQAI
jgi:hypothetical protein